MANFRITVHQNCLLGVPRGGKPKGPLPGGKRGPEGSAAEAVALKFGCKHIDIHTFFLKLDMSFAPGRVF